MILGLDKHPAGACFTEYNAAVEAMTDRVVCFNAHQFTPPPGSIVYNLENASQLKPGILDSWKGHEVWDFSERNAKAIGAKYVPVGYHPSMQRFKRAEVLDIDVAFCGSLNERRGKVLQELGDRGLVVAVCGPNGPHGATRDDVLSRCKVALNMLFYEDGVFPALRVAHLAANSVPVISERAPEDWWFLARCDYRDLVEVTCQYVADHVAATSAAEYALRAFKAMPLVLP